MSYFQDKYEHFRYPLKDNDEGTGFRQAQLGAIHSLAAHFVTRSDPGIVTMPTGSGKTAVLISAAFVLRANRVLIITPSRMVREQIAREVSTLSTLRSVGALDNAIQAPSVFSTKKRIKAFDEWEEMRQFDVVVGTVPSISPEYVDVPEPPPDLFDLVIVDEAHHSPARTWQAILNHFDQAKRLLFTATPFRQDQKEIKGRFIFTYDLRKAFEDNVFGEITFRPVTPDQDENHDIAIACSAELQFRQDQEQGFQHRLMVRTDTRNRATELLDVYQQHTGLRLSVVTGDKSLRFVKKVVDQLDEGELDGIICVNMLGEGFNFPSLKIAAIHSPHRSLAVTLQFIGRFARTVGENIGSATFLAIPSEIEIEAERLYDTRAVWQDMVQNLSATRVHEEAQIREVLETFSTSELNSEDLDDLSLFVLEPYYHVKIYQLNGMVELANRIEFPESLQVVYESVSGANNAAVYITREITLPRWTTDDRLSIVQPDLFIFFQDPETQLLFICASRRSAGLYEQIVESFRGSDPRPLPLVRLNRALNDLGAPEFFNVGMRNRVSSNTTESYRIITGSNADKAILKSDGRLYHRGHVFGRASDQEGLITIGLSSASKIWSNRSGKLPELIKWCKQLAIRISSNREPNTGSGLEYLDVGEEINELPRSIIGINWPVSVYRNPPQVRFPQDHQQNIIQLLDFDLSIDIERSTDQAVFLNLQHESGLIFSFTFSFETDRFFELATENEPELAIERDRDSIPMLTFLNEEMPQFYTADLSLVHGYSLLKIPEDGVPPFDDGLFVTLDWASRSVEITREFGHASAGFYISS